MQTTVYRSVKNYLNLFSKLFKKPRAFQKTRNSEASKNQREVGRRGVWRGAGPKGLKHTPNPGKGMATTQGRGAFSRGKRVYHAVGVGPEFSAGYGIITETNHRAQAGGWKRA